jgi:hypothetical protein
VSNRIKYPDKKRCFNRAILFGVQKSWQLSQSVSSLNVLGVLFLFCGGLLCQGSDFFCGQDHIVDTNVIDQATE